MNKNRLFLVFALPSILLLASCGGSSDDQTPAPTQSTTAKKQPANSQSTPEQSTPKNLKPIAPDKGWGKAMANRGISLENVFAKYNKEKGVLDVYFGSTFISELGPNETHGDPVKQVLALKKIMPKPLTEDNLWGKRLRKKDISLKGLYCVVHKSAHTTDIYNKDGKLQTMGTPKSHIKDKAGKQLNQLIEKLKKN